jgi:hypothetical protein
MDVKLSDEDVVQPTCWWYAILSRSCARTLKARRRWWWKSSRPIRPRMTAFARARSTPLPGVREYWIVTPWPHVVEVLSLDGRGYRLHRAFGKDDTLTQPDLSRTGARAGGCF